MLEFVVGAPASGKTDYLMRRIAADVRQGRQAVLLTTRQATHAMERRLVCDYLPQGLLRVQVLDVERLAQRILDDAGGAAGETMSAVGRLMGVHTVVEQCREKLSLYAASIAQTGFCSRVAAQLDTLKRWNVSAQQLQEAAQQVQDAQLRRKLEDISRIAQACQAYFAARGCAVQDSLMLAAQKINAGALEWIGQCTFYIDGLQSEDAATRYLLSAVLSRCAHMYITIPIDQAHMQQARFDAPRQAYALFRQMAADCGVDTRVRTLEIRETKEKELAHLRENLFVYPGRAFDGPARRVVLQECRDPRREAEWVAAKILTLCRDRAMRFRDFTVVCADEQSGFSQIRRAFERFDVAAFYDARMDLRGSTAVELVLQLVQACRAPWRSEQILAILKSGLTRFDPQEIYLAENLILKRGIDGSRRWKQPWRGADAQQAESLRQEIVRILTPFFETMRTKVQTYTRVEAIFCVLDELGVRKRLEETVLQLQEAGASQEAAITAQIWKVLCEVLGQLSHVQGDAVFSTYDFAAVLREGFSCIQLAAIPTTLDQVTVSTLRRWNAEGARVVFVMGATDTALSPTLDGDGLLDEADVRALQSEAQLVVAQNAQQIAAQFKTQIYRTLCAARDAVIVTRPLRDMTGQPTGRSQLVAHLQRLFPHAASADAARDTLPECAAQGFTQWAHGLRRRQEGLSFPAWLDAAGTWFAQHEPWAQRARQVYRSMQLQTQDSLSRTLCAQLFDPVLRMSVTQLECYAQCPFSHFAKYALQVRQREAFQPGARPDTGTLLHEMMRRLGTDIQSGVVDLQSFDAQACSRWTEDALASLGEESYYSWLFASATGRAIAQRLQENIAVAAQNMVRSLRQSRFDIAAVECVIPPMELLDTQTEQIVHLTGRVDRIDIAHLPQFDAVRVIDYKSSAKNTALEQIYYGQKLQLAAYLMAVCDNPQLFCVPQLKPAGMLYFPIGDRDTQDEDRCRMQGIVNADASIMEAMDTARTQSGRSLIVAPVSRGTRSGRVEDGQMALLLRYTRDELTSLAFAAVKGDARALPSRGVDDRSNPCTWCPYAGACGFDERKRPLIVKQMPKLEDEQTLLRMQEAQKTVRREDDDENT